MKTIDSSRLLTTRGISAAIGKPRLDPEKLLLTRGLAVMPGKPVDEF